MQISGRDRPPDVTFGAFCFRCSISLLSPETLQERVVSYVAGDDQFHSTGHGPYLTRGHTAPESTPHPQAEPNL